MATLLTLLIVALPIRAAVRVQRPITYDGGRINQYYLWGEDSHRGVDFSYGLGTYIYAVADGTVVQFKEDVDDNTWPQNPRNDWGNFVLIRHNGLFWDRTTQQNAYVYSIYAHLKKDSVRPSVGQFVTAGTWIAEVDNTGHSTGNHLHLQICLHPQSDRLLWPTNTLNSENTSRNPELWLQPFNYGGANTGAVVGKVTDSNGNAVSNLRIYGLSKPLGSAGTNYVWSETYSDPALNPDDIVVENWGTTDVYPGTYHLEAKYTNGTLYEDLGWHTVEAGKTTYVGLYPVYLPDIMENYYGWNSSIVVRNNSDSKTAQVNTTFFWENGEVRTQKTDYIAPRGTVVVDFPGTCYYCRGSAIVAASEDVAVVVEHTNGTRYNNYNGISATGLDPGWGQTGAAIYVPLTKYDFDGKSSRLYILNTGPAATDVTITSYYSNGSQADSTPCPNLAPAARCDLRPPAPAAGRYAVRISAGQPLAVVVAEEQHSDPNVIYKVQNPFASGATVGFAPQVKRQWQGEYSTLAVQNLGGWPFTVTVTYYPDSGGSCSHSAGINPQGYYVFQTQDAPGCPVSSFVGAARVSAPGTVAVLVNEKGEKGNSGFLTGSQSVVLPQVRRDGGWWTGIRVMNADGGAPTNGAIYFYHPDGSAAGSGAAFTINSAYRSVNLGSAVPAGFHGAARIVADRPVAVSAILTLNNSAEQTMMYNGCNR